MSERGEYSTASLGLECQSKELWFPWNVSAPGSFDEESDMSELYFDTMHLPSKMQWRLEKRRAAEPWDQPGY